MACRKRPNESPQAPKKACASWRFPYKTRFEDGLYVCEVGDNLELGFSDHSEAEAVEDARSKLLRRAALRQHSDARCRSPAIVVSAVEYYSREGSPSPMAHVFI